MKRSSLRKAIDSHCKQCIYDNLCPGTWRQQVTLCTVFKCPLWEVRPRAATQLLPDAGIGHEMVEKGQSEAVKATQGDV